MQETAQQYISRILGNVEGEDALKVQRQTAPKLAKAIRGLSPKQLRSRPQPDKWSIAEIMAHLADAEIVVNRHGSALDEPLDQMAPDESGTADDERAHAKHFLR